LFGIGFSLLLDSATARAARLWPGLYLCVLLALVWTPLRPGAARGQQLV